MAVAAKVDWFAYFESIKEVCPWSQSALLQGRIRIETWHSQILNMDNNLAIVYRAPNHKPRQLKRITDRLNTEYPEYEFLWSHPRYGGNSTPLPVIIQQSHETLKKIRNSTKKL